MSLIASLALAAASTGPVLPHCSWDRPGVNPFTGDVVAAVDRYKDIPEPVRARLKKRMQERSYDEFVSIKRDAITGKAQYSSDIRDMHFGSGSVCKTVSRSKWTDKTEERGLVYCEESHCILVPTVCRNVSRITRLESRQPVAAQARDTQMASATSEEVPETELITEAPAAGVPALRVSEQAAPSFNALAMMGSGGLPIISGTPQGPGFPGTGLVPPGPPSIEVPPTPAVPEPSSWAMMLLGVLGLMAARRWAVRSGQ